MFKKATESLNFTCPTCHRTRVPVIAIGVDTNSESQLFTMVCVNCNGHFELTIYKNPENVPPYFEYWKNYWIGIKENEV